MLCRFWEGSGGFELCFGSVWWVMGDRGLGLCHEHMVAPGILQFFRRGKGVTRTLGFPEVERLKEWHWYDSTEQSRECMSDQVKPSR